MNRETAEALEAIDEEREWQEALAQAVYDGPDMSEVCFGDCEACICYCMDIPIETPCVRGHV